MITIIKRILTVLVVIFSTSGIHAQSNGFAGFFTIGYSNISKAEKKLQLMMPGMKQFTNNYYGIGGEGYWKYGRRILGAHANIYTHGVVSDGENFGEPFSGSGIIKVGYVVYESKKIFIYPTIGGGVTGTVITSYEKHANVKSNLHSIYLFSPAIDLALHLDPIVYRFNNQPASGVFITGLSTGYRISKKSDHWNRLTNSQIQKTSFANNGFYVSLAFGMGYFKSTIQ